MFTRPSNGILHMLLITLNRLHTSNLRMHQSIQYFINVNNLLNSVTQFRFKKVVTRDKINICMTKEHTFVINICMNF